MLGLFLLLWSAGPSTASCVLPPGEVGPHWNDAEIVILGTVRAVADHERIATVVVEEIWRGPELPSEVVVRGGFATGDMFTSGDRRFEAGVRYLFDLASDPAGNLQDNACSLTAEWSAELAVHRPEDARVVAARTATDSNVVDLAGPAGVVAVVGIVALILLGVALGVRRLDV